jgi:hypothetical protein
MPVGGPSPISASGKSLSRQGTVTSHMTDPENRRRSSLIHQCKRARMSRNATDSESQSPRSLDALSMPSAHFRWWRDCRGTGTKVDFDRSESRSPRSFDAHCPLRLTQHVPLVARIVEAPRPSVTNQRNLTRMLRIRYGMPRSLSGTESVP